MPNYPASTVQTAFASGELSPRVRGRTDLEQYFRGVAKLRNFLVQKHGGLTKRPGTRFVAEVKNSGKAVRLQNFEVSDETQYILEFGDEYLRFYKYSGGLPVQIEDAGTPTEKTTLFAAANLPDLKFTQSADVMLITHPTFKPTILQRSGVNDTLPASWDISSTLFAFKDGPYDPINITATTITPSATTGTVTLTASTGIFASTDVDRWVRLLHGAIWGWAQITVFTSSTVVTAVVHSVFGGTSATTNWRLGSWHGGVVGGNHWPTVAVFHQGRLYLAGSRAEPQTIWGSVVGDFFTFSPSKPDGTVLDTSALNLEIDDDKLNAIRWMVSDRVGLVVLASGGEYVLSAGEDRAITPGNFAIRRQSTYGSSKYGRPQQIGASIVFWQGSRKLRELAYSIENDRIGGPDLAVLSEHIARNGVCDTAYMEVPDSLLWTCLADGLLVGITLEREQKVVAWHIHQIGGTWNGGIARVESVAVIRRHDGFASYDQLWMQVVRTIDGVDKRYVEVMQDQFDFDQTHQSAWFLDSALPYSGAAVTSIIGLEHLEGESVGVFGDAATYPNATVASGAIAVSPAVSTALVGLPFVSEMETMPLAPAAPYEPRGRLRRATKTFLQLWRSIGGEIGPTQTDVDPLIYRTPSVTMDQATPLFTGVLEKAVDISAGLEVSVKIQHKEPQPFTVLSLFTEVDLGG